MSKNLFSSRDPQELQKRRLEAAKLFGKGWKVAAVAKHLGVTRQSAHQWKKTWKSQGAGGLQSKGKVGRKPKLTDQDKQSLVEHLLAGPEHHGYSTALWTLPRVAKLISKITGKSLHPGRVWHVLKDLGFSCQKPTTRAMERNEEAIRQWRLVKWPDIKKKQQQMAER